MSEKPQTGPYIVAFALLIEQATGHIEMIGNNGKPRVRDYEAEARWYVAWHMANDMHSSYTSKDWAYCVLDGMQPLSDEDVKEFLYPEDEEPNIPTHEELIKWFLG